MGGSGVLCVLLLVSIYLRLISTTFNGLCLKYDFKIKVFFIFYASTGANLVSHSLMSVVLHGLVPPQVNRQTELGFLGTQQVEDRMLELKRVGRGLSPALVYGMTDHINFVH